MSDRPPPYRSLKEAEEGEEPISGPCYTAPPSPVMEKFADINLLGNMFSCLDEPEGQQLSLAKSLEDLRTPKDPQEQQKLIYQVPEDTWDVVATDLDQKWISGV